MRGHRLISAIRDLLGKGADTSEVEPLAEIPSVPLPAGAMPGWRSYRCMTGPYERFRVHYPRDWDSIVGEGGDPIHMKPVSGDVAVTVSANTEPVFGPQGIIDLIEGMANSRGVPFERRTVKIDRWEDDGWAGSWAWRERDRDGTTRLWRMLVLGHEQGNLIGMVNGAEGQLVEHSARCEEILTSILLPPSNVLAPESFPLALCELLNDRRVGNEPYWYLNEEGHLCCADLVVRLANIYRSYLQQQDLDEVAAQLDLRTQRHTEIYWQGRSWAEICDRLRVVLRRQESIAGMDIVSIPMHGGLVACPVLDSKEQITFIPKQEALRWGLGPGAILTRAVAALDSESSVSLIELRDSETDALKGFRIAADDGYDSGRLLCPSLRAALEETLGTELLVAMPAARSVLVLRDSDESRKLLSSTASSNYQSRARPLSEDLWLWTEAGLELLDA